jgi:polyisoprenoid-binding protein YceI
VSPCCMRLALALALIAACGPSQAAPVAYRFDPEATFVYFEVLHFRTSTLRGRFGPLAGFVRFDAAAGTGEIGIEVATGTVDTGMKAFDARLRQPDLLASEGWPTAWFVAREWHFVNGQPSEIRGEHFVNGQPSEIRGEFTLRGESQPLSLIADRFACRSDAGREICGGDFHAEFRRSAFGMTFGLPFVGDRVRLLVRVEGRRE